MGLLVLPSKINIAHYMHISTNSLLDVVEVVGFDVAGGGGGVVDDELDALTSEKSTSVTSRSCNEPNH